MSETVDPRRDPARPLRVAPVPGGHPYLEAVRPDGVRHVVADAAGCSVWLDPRYLTSSAADVDVLHVLAGHLPLTGPAVDAWTTAVRRTGVPLVVTVLDLVGPDGPDAGPARSRHRAHLRALLATAEVVFTLTPGAADEIADRYGRTAIVVAHPSLAEPTLDVGRETRLVGLHLGRFEAGPAGAAALVRGALSGAVSGGGRLRVDVHPEADLGAGPPGLAELAAAGELDLRRSWPVDPSSSVKQLQELHVCVLPPETGCTHSGWVELCRDAGTRAVVPGGGHHAGQWSDVVAYGCDPQTGPDAASLHSAVVAALTRPAPGRADRGRRAEQRAAVRQVYAQVYAQVAADRTAV
ncbi:hypothetical protein [Modestobacter marinus]|uniref:hypothetical protein n=1 Tax=Modestobacter marinus TaxID=477641 RepID=UPI0021BC2133|nr:hypothetical protein [Modestobacter marinus]